VLEACSDDRQGWVPLDTCVTRELCDETLNPTLGGGLVVGSDGMVQLEAPATPAQVTACQLPACAVGEVRCEGTLLRYCSEGRTGFVTAEECATAVWPEQPVTAARPGQRVTRPVMRPRAGPEDLTELSTAPTTPLPAFPGTPPSKHSRTPFLVGSAVVAAAIVGGYFALRRSAPPHEPATASSDSTPVRDSAAVRAPPSRAAVVTPPVAAQGYITVNAEPYGELYIDGVDVGPTPMVRYAVRPGTHTIKVVREGFKTVDEKVHVDAGNTVPKRYTLLPGG